ncbi:MAG TPA: hypothetical protein ENN40_05030 [Candidatus Aminicenantes bacterium]|nr:hypothetical protein [Candidatus Aminicenantes bacterium]
MRSISSAFAASLIWIALALSGCAGQQAVQKMTLNYVEYNRGKSFPTRSDICLDWDDHLLRFHGVRFSDDSFFPDNSIIPNAFLRPLIQLRFSDALKAFTEPYYGYRLMHFFRRNPHIGLGIEFTHHKLFLNDPRQQVRISGTFQGKSFDQSQPASDFIDYLSVSHGVNHLNLVVTYRWMLAQTASIPDGRWQPFVATGFGPAFPHLELKLAQDFPQWSEYAYQAGWRNFNFSAGIGMRFKFSPYLGAYLEYKFSYSHLHDMHFHDGSGDLSMAFDTHHLMWGISLIF